MLYTNAIQTPLEPTTSLVAMTQATYTTEYEKNNVIGNYPHIYT